MTHLTREQVGVIESFLKFGVCVLTFNRYAKQAGASD